MSRSVPARTSRTRRLAALVAAAAVLSACAGGPELSFEGPEDDEVVNAEQLESAEIAVRADLAEGDESPFTEATVERDGEDVTAEAAKEEDELRYPLADLDDGEHEITVDVPGEGSRTFTFVVDATAPELEVSEPEDGVVFGDDDVMVVGRTDADAELTIAGDDVEVADDGTFERSFDAVPDDAVLLVATDAAGNVTEQELTLTQLPSRVEVDEVRAVHVTPHAWATESFRERVLGMFDDGLINAIQLDLKDEGGRIGYRTEVPLARESGAAEDVYDLDEAIEELHGRGIHVVGRIVAFRDPMLGAYAMGAGHDDWLIQTPGGDPYTATYGCCFTSFANPDVTDYLLDIAEEAAAAGVDAILWDYIRRPDGSPDNMVVPGLSDDADGATLEEAVVDFAKQADERLAPYRLEHGASLYGIAADRPTQIAQDVPALAEHLDYVSPMIYPSHWGPGEYGVEDPNRQPYDIITATLEIWKEQVEGKRARIVPWLEDTTYRAWDRPFQVREQIRATRDQGIDEWLMWDPVVRYTPEAYEARTE
ncbi:MAG: putative glycoside hydrolase [Nitriliruptor sp.]